MAIKTRIKIVVDLCMAIALLLLMAYSLIGELAHEWIGVGMFALIVVHNLLNVRWYRNLLIGRYTAFRAFRLINDISLFFLIIGIMVSGISMSRYALASLPDIISISSARTLHMLCAYWGFVLMSLHIGLHANMLMGMMRKAARVSKPSKTRTIMLRIAPALICAYGIYAFMERQIGSYMFLMSEFVFFDYEEPLMFFFADYIAVMGLFICAGYYLSGAIRKIQTKSFVKEKNNMI
jgi:hypothetical protein